MLRKEIEIEVTARPNTRDVKKEKETKIRSFIDRVKAKKMGNTHKEWNNL